MTDESYYTKGTDGKEYEPCKVTDFSKLDIRDGAIHFFLYAQDGSKTPMKYENTYCNRLLVSYIQIRDRY